MSDVTVHPAGTTATDLQIGDFILTGVKAQGIVSWAIKTGSWLRGYEKLHRRFSHTALVTDPNGLIAEAMSEGVVENHISRYTDDDYVVVHTHLDEHDKAQLLDFAAAVVQAKTKYGFITFFGLAIYCLTGGGLCIQQAGTAICSGFVSDALTRGGYIWARPPYAMMPADLAKHFGVNWMPGE